MTRPDTPIASTRPPLEKVAAGLVGVMVLLTLASRAITWDWLFDTPFLLAAVWVAFGRARADRFPLVLCYLFLDSATQALVGLVFPGLMPLLYLVLAVLYGAALRRRLGERGIAVKRLPWRGLFRRPALWLTAAALAPLACLYLPMLHYHRDALMSSPIIVTVGQAIAMSPARPLIPGTEVLYRGIQVAYSRGACLLLAAIGALHLLRLGGAVQTTESVRYMRVASVCVALWWLVPARGFSSLDNIFDLLFVAGCGTLLVFLFISLPEDGTAES